MLVFDAKIKSVFLVIAGLGLASGAAHAVDGGGSAKVNVVSPLSITQSQELNFGIVAPGVSTGTVAVAVGGAVTQGNTAVYFTGSGAQNGAFDIVGDQNRQYSIALPASASLTGGGNPILVDGFISDPAVTGLLDINGLQEVRVGATLHLPSGQATGIYTGSYTVTVLYQ